MPVATYYFDASDAAVSDPDFNWTGDANATDGSTATVATANGGIAGTTATGFLLIEGTNAPSTGGSITQVRARINGYNSSNSAGLAIQAVIYTNSLAQNLGTASVDATSTPGTWGSYTTLSTPTGGWDWSKLQALETKIVPTAADVVDQYAARVEIEVTSSDSQGSATISWVTG